MHLTKPQQLIYDSEKYVGGSIGVMCGILTVRVPCGEDRLLRAIREIRETNYALNLRLDESGDVPALYYAPPAGTDEIPVLRVGDPADLRAVGETAAQTPFDLRGPLCDLRAVLFPGGCGILVRLHHLLGDAWSMSLIGTQLIELLNGGSPVRYSYEEYAETEDAYLHGGRYARDRQFFLERFDACPAPVLLSDREAGSYRTRQLRYLIPAETRTALRSAAEAQGLTEFSCLLGLVAALYARLKNDPEAFFLGVPVMNRVSERELHTVGMYVNTVPVLFRPDYGKTVRENLKLFAGELLSVYRHQKYNYHDIAATLREERGFSGRLFDCTVNYQSDVILSDHAIQAREYSRNMQTENLQILFQDRNDSGALEADVLFRTDVLDEAAVRGFCDAFRALTDPAGFDRPLRAVSVLTAADRETLRRFSEGPRVPIPEKNVCDLLREQAERTPDAVAVIAADGTLTYRALDRTAERIAAGLRQRGVRPGDRVAIALPRNVRLLPALLGVLKAGASYVPVDGTQPEARTAQILADAGAVLCLRDPDVSAAAESTAPFVPAETAPDAECYLIFTSGSTGKPKGVSVSHRNAVNYLLRSPGGIPGGVLTDKNKTILSVTAVTFDIFVTESLLPLAHGMTVVLADDEQAVSPSAFRALTEAYGIDTIQTTPTKFDLLTRGLDLRAALRPVKTILLGGEALPPATAERILSQTDAALYNVYGPAETTVWSSFARIDSAESISVGRPVTNTKIMVLGPDLQPVPVGATGQICIAGSGVSDGYPNDAALTARKFVPDPETGETAYLTGDLGYWRQDGNLVFVGRADDQIKLHGRRIEPGEIEAALSSLDGIALAAVRLRQDREGPFLCAYYTGAEQNARALRAALREKLPQHMIPRRFVYLEKMPVTGSGKIDRKALPEPPADPGNGAPFAAPETPAETALARAVCAVLHADRVGMLENFTELGGDSLKSVALISALETEGFTVSARDIFTAEDLRGLAGKLRPAGPAAERTVPAGARTLSGPQRAVYAAQTLAPDKPLYNIPYLLHTEEEIDPVRLQKAADALLQLNDVLRAGFALRDGEPVRIDDPDAVCRIERLPEDPAAFIRPFDLSRPPLLRIGLGDRALLLDAHHLIADGTSMRLYLDALNDLYMGRPAAPLPDPPVGEPAEDVRRAQKPSVGAGPATFPADRPRPREKTYRGNTLYRTLSARRTDEIRNACRRTGVTPFAYWLSAFAFLLASYSGQTEPTVGVPVNVRSAEERNAAGLFVRTLPVTLCPAGDLSVREYLKQTLFRTRPDPAHGCFSREAEEKERAPGSADGDPAFRVMLTYQTADMTALTFGDRPAVLQPLVPGVSKCDLELTVYPQTDTAVWSVTYDTDLYDQASVEMWMEELERLLTVFLSADAALRDLSVLTADDREKLLRLSEGPRVPIPGKSVYGLFAEQAEKHPEKIGITGAGRPRTFADLREAAEKVDCCLRARTGGQKQTVAVIADRSFAELAALFGVVRGGCAYLPVSPAFPPARIRQILEDCGCSIVLAQEAYRGLTANAFCIEDILKTDPVAVPPPAAMPEDTLYVIYTSGSTGTPKGAMVSNRSAVNRLLWMTDRYFDADTVVMLKTPYTFDVSVWEIFGWAAAGFRLHILPPEDHYDQARVLSCIPAGGVTALHFVPTVWRAFLQAAAADPEAAEKLRSLRSVFLSGEAMTAADVNRFTALFPDSPARIHNLYGPAECAVDVTYHDCGRTERDPVPIGRPIQNTRIHVLDRDLRPVPPGAQGELCIAGANVGQGYRNRPDLTAAKFIDDPFGAGKLYKTGDLARLNEDGELIFLGRCDDQIKLNGQRIEPGEIEAAIKNLSGVSDAAVLKVPDPDRLIAFFTGEPLSGKEVRKALRETLPAFMIPAAFLRLDAMPVNASGKTDRAALAALPRPVPEEPDVQLPETETERAVCDAFARVLQTGPVGRDSDFYALGGTSLRLAELLSQPPLNALTPSQFLTDPTPAGLAALLDADKKPAYSFLVPLYTPAQAEGALLLTAYAGGDASAYVAFVRTFRERGAKTALYYVPWLTAEEIRPAADEIASLCETVPTEFYAHCAGVSTALRLLDVLNRDKRRIDRMTVGGNIPPASPAKAFNVWRFLPDRALLAFLRRAGLDTEGLRASVLRAALRRFRRDVAQYYDCFRQERTPTDVRLRLILSKKDPFTHQWARALSNWSAYVTAAEPVIFTKRASHYFLKESADILLDRQINE